MCIDECMNIEQSVFGQVCIDECILLSDQVWSGVRRMPIFDQEKKRDNQE